MRKSSATPSRYRPGTSRKPPSLDTFREQMADFVRGERLTELRKATHLSRENAAAQIGVTTKSLYAWEHGGKIKWENAKKVGAFYKVDPETLITREDPADAGSPNGAMEPTQLDRVEIAVMALSEKLDAMSRAVALTRRDVAQLQKDVGKRQLETRDPDRPAADDAT